LPDLSEKSFRFLRARWLVPLALAVIIVGGVLVFKTVMSSKVHSRVAELRAAGYPVTSIELNAWHKQVPWKENAAMKVMEAAGALSTNSQNWDRIKWPQGAEPLSAEVKAKLEQILTNNSEALRLLQPAFELEQSRYSVDWRPGPGALLPHLAKVRVLAELLRIQAVLAAEAKDSGQSAKSIIQLLKLSRTLLTEPCLVSQQVRIRIADYAASSLERALNECTFTDTQLEMMFKAFQSADGETQQGLTRALMGEMSLGDYVFNSPSRELMAIVDLPDEYVLTFGFLRATGLMDRDFLFYLTTMQRSIKASEQAFPEGLTTSRQITSETAKRTQGAPDLIISRMLLPFLEKSFEKFGSHEARLRCVETAVALQLYRQRQGGKAPDALDKLVPTILKNTPVDPFTGKILRYRPMAEGFMVYSVGPDQKDDGGLTENPSGNEEEFGALSKPKRPSSVGPVDITFTVWR